MEWREEKEIKGKNAKKHKERKERQQIHVANKINSRVICWYVCLMLGRRQMGVIGL